MMKRKCSGYTASYHRKMSYLYNLHVQISVRNGITYNKDNKKSSVRKRRMEIFFTVTDTTARKHEVVRCLSIVMIPIHTVL